MTNLLGLPLDQALEALRALGVQSPQVETTECFRRAASQGELRVVRVQDNGRRITVAGFIVCPQPPERNS
ncbi:MAG TPA: hypothetical protein IAA59_07810 [Candidatus Faecaligallichristensenella faecipullorum]|nr:hypothetical protein [Candidatus Faecaligallichristensenella faecipullorum]